MPSLASHWWRKSLYGMKPVGLMVQCFLNRFNVNYDLPIRLLFFFFRKALTEETWTKADGPKEIGSNNIFPSTPRTHLPANPNRQFSLLPRDEFNLGSSHITSCFFVKSRWCVMGGFDDGESWSFSVLRGSIRLQTALERHQPIAVFIHCTVAYRIARPL